MINEDKTVATAFFNGYALSFEYKKLEETDYKQRLLHTITKLEYNDDEEILVHGMIKKEGVEYEYRKFFLENMRDIKCWKKVAIEYDT
jgi:hypothetical protein